MTKKPGGDRGRQGEPVEVRFWRKVKKNRGGCWEWQGGLNNSGYGAMMVGSRRDGSRRSVGVHRLAFELAGIEIPDGMEPDHICGVRHCVKIGKKHLVLVTVAENRGKFQRRKTHCLRGHKLPGPDARGRRRCSHCHNLEVQAAYRRKHGGLRGQPARKKRVLSDKKVRKLLRWHARGDKLSEIATRLGVSETAVRYWIKKGM